MATEFSRKIVAIVGPTASGKSKIALDLAETQASVIINADSLQVYSDLPILTSQPSELSQQLVPHELYGFADFQTTMNVQKWAEKAALIIEKSFTEQKLPIVVGGTGMYIKCLLEGISDLPSVSDENRRKADEWAHTNYSTLCDIVYENDPALKTLISPAQHRQMLRAYEIFLQTGQSIRVFFEKPKRQFLKNFKAHVKMPKFERSALYEEINKRFMQMLESGAIDEVERLLQKTAGNTSYPVFQALGALEIVDFLNKKTSLVDVVEKATRRSRQYAKRQITWFKNQLQSVELI